VNKAFIKYLKTKQAVTRFYNKKINNVKLKREIIKQSPKLLKIKLVDKLHKVNIPVICFVDNDLLNIPSFLKYYRDLGIRQFAFIDFSNNNKTTTYLKEQSDVSIWKSSKDWNNKVHKTKIINFFLLKHLKKKARPLILNSTEYIIYPYMETRNINDLFGILNDFEQVSAFCIRIDLYSKYRIDKEQIKESINPFSLFPYMDRYNYVQDMLPWDVCKIQGGPLLRTTFNLTPDDAPWLNSVQLMLNDKKTLFNNYKHATDSWKHNCSIKHDHRFVTIALANFIQFKENNLTDNFYNKHWSIKYQNPKQIEQMNIMQRGEWF